jgi:16S rRNA (guanine527-N7)-methyltransferase
MQRSGLAMSAPERYHWRSMAAKVDELVDRVSADLAVPLSQGARQGIVTWLARLAEWNARIDLTAARSPEELVDLMLADALVLSSRIAAGARVVDVGTGAGAPGLPLALLRDDLRVVLVEPLGKRVSFLRTVVGAIGRTDVEVERGRGEALAGRRTFDVAVSRATLSPGEWLALAVRLVVPGGRAWVLLATDEPPRTPLATLVEEHRYEWPLTKAKRTLAGYRVGEP